ncbi:dehydrogenase [Cohnella nanjingensis]|uniref:Dehydrogenase n=1 Tax=Cohnella nanjingensis TaxID=1387779 RepID=A0A7X0RUY7_9BACL|nr:dehydrogenase [Cohnella nanjingensis]MBB6672574.1 dehydrogenase [Cohnella nanjingensis]
MKMGKEKHASPLPNPRGIRRACSNELYRTAKRLKTYVSADQMKQAEELYVRRVISNLLWIHDHRSDRKKLADWWETELSGEIAALWNVDRERLVQAFRDAFGG